MWQGGPLQVNSSRFPDGSYDQRWYNWNITNWGTKWSAYDIEVTHEEGNDCVVIWFSTAWSPLSIEVFERMSAQMPDAEFTCQYQEAGCDFYGVTYAKNGMAADQVSDLTGLKDTWILREFPAEKIAIYHDSDHPQYDEVYDEIWDAWYERGEQQSLEPAFESMAEELKENLAPSAHKLKGAALIHKILELFTSVEAFAKAEDGFLGVAYECGYDSVEEFSTAFFATHEWVEYSVSKQLEGLSIK